MQKRTALALIAIAMALLVLPMTSAHLIYLYKQSVSFVANTPIVFSPGSNAGQVSLVVSNETSTLVKMTIPVTNATAIYSYQPLKFTVNNEFGTSTPTLYIDECSFSSSSGLALSNVTLIVYPTTGTPTSPTGEIVLYPSTSGCTASGSVSLTQGTSYYIDVMVTPSLPVPKGTNVGQLSFYLSVANSTATVTVPTP